MHVSSIINLRLNPLLMSSQITSPINNTEEASPVQMELSGAEVGRTMLAAQGITFKGQVPPIDVTEKLNKKVEGKSHLDLPNLKVYDYPDTNLRVFVNSVSDNSDGMNFPPVVTMIQRSGEIKEDLIEEALIQFVLEKRVKSNLTGSFSSVLTPGVTTYDFSTSEAPLNKLADYYRLLSQTSISNDELEFAKDELKKYLETDDYKKSYKFCSAYYSEEGDIYSKDELSEILDEITPDVLSGYYLDFISKSKIETFISVERNQFDIKSLNNSAKNLDSKFANISDVDNENSPPFVPNHKMIVQRGNEGSGANLLEVLLPTSSVTRKDTLVSELAVSLLDEILPEQLFIYGKSENIPINLKNKGKNFDFTYCMLKMEGSSENIETKLEELREILINALKEENLDAKLNRLIQEKKDFYNMVFTDKEFPLAMYGYMQYSSDVFSLYEMLDSITVQDIKNFVNTYLIEQEPIVVVNG